MTCYKLHLKCYKLHCMLQVTADSYFYHLTYGGPSARCLQAGASSSPERRQKFINTTSNINMNIDNNINIDDNDTSNNNMGPF